MMRKESSPDRSGFVDDPPSDVQVTIVSSNRGPTVGERLSHLSRVVGARAIIGLALVMLVAGAAVAAVSLGGRPGRRLRRIR
jgi:hypothetical protein